MSILTSATALKVEMAGLLNINGVTKDAVLMLLYLMSFVYVFFKDLFY